MGLDLVVIIVNIDLSLEIFPTDMLTQLENPLWSIVANTLATASEHGMSRGSPSFLQIYMVFLRSST